MTELTVRMEVDVAPSERETFTQGYVWRGENEFDGISVTVLPTEGHGFGLTEIVDVAVVLSGPVAAGVAVNLLTDALKSAVGGTIRRARAHRGQAALPIPEEDEVFDIEATTVNETVSRALSDSEK